MESGAPVIVGAVGTGRIFNHAHLPIYPQLFRTARLVGFFDVSRERASEACDRHREVLKELATTRPEWETEIEENMAQLAVHDSLESMLEVVDAVDIATHARGRMPTAIAAFGAGVSVMAEKPMARTWTETDRAIRALESANRDGGSIVFQLNDDNVFDPKYRMIRDIIRRGEIGNVQHMTLIRGCRLESDNILPAEVTGLENGGGALMAYGSHGLAGALSLFWPQAVPVEVEAVSITTRHPDRTFKGETLHLEVDDNAQIKVKVEDPVTGSWSTVFFEATLVGGHIGLSATHSGGQNSGLLQIIGTKGMIDSESSTSMTLKYWNGGVEEIPIIEYPGESISFKTEMSEFFDAYAAGRTPVYGAQFGANIIATCGASYLSAKVGGTVSIDQFKQYSSGFVDRLGDTSDADDAIIVDLLEPYTR